MEPIHSHKLLESMPSATFYLYTCTKIEFAKVIMKL